ncbi:MAG: NAD(P)/FAD-dependent oxidoreductase [Actinomycetota bacterium]|nr:NAD(P)/FAD-dependent oxidoreductase [Actinomycetota bacterium]
MADSSDIAFDPDATQVDAVVIGAGFGGLYSVHKLRNEMGLTVQAFDTATGVGGTWYWNRYPGARSDTEVTAYCYSFDKDLFNEWNWTQRYPLQPEILAYLNHVADRYDLRRSYQFETTITGTRWNEETGRWEVVTGDGRHYAARFLVEGVGLLSSTNVPDFPGLSSFAGESYHTARWPKDGVDLKGKRVALIGTGSTGVQVAVSIAPEVEHLSVFQRHAQWTVPAQHRPIAPDFLDFIKANYDEYWESVRQSASAFGIHESDQLAASATPEEQEEAFEKQWNSGGGFQFMLGVYADVVADRDANKAATDFIARKIREIVKDPETARLLTPDELYAKRPLCDDGYYAIFNRDNVELVDVKAHAIAEITPRGIKTADGVEREFDVIILATGFDAFTGNYLKFPQYGRDGVSLADKWAERPLAWESITAAGFPNWFMIFGPFPPFTNQPPAHEFQVNYIAALIKHAIDTGAKSIEVKGDVELSFVETCDELYNTTLFAVTDSWINGTNIPGKPRACMVNVAGMRGHVAALRQSEADGYPEFIVDGASVNA